MQGPSVNSASSVSFFRHHFGFLSALLYAATHCRNACSAWAAVKGRLVGEGAGVAGGVGEGEADGDPMARVVAGVMARVVAGVVGVGWAGPGMSGGSVPQPARPVTRAGPSTVRRTDIQSPTRNQRQIGTNLSDALCGYAPVARLIAA